jgi:hypothetical protein
MAIPTITDLAPGSGTTAGGNPVVITGTDFTNPTVTSVTFDGNAASFIVDSDTRITATSPAHATGSVTVTVTNASGSATLTYTYTTGLTLAPTTGSQGGGTTVDIYGANLTGITAMKFGTQPATSFTVLSGTHVQTVSPAGCGVVGVTVTTPGGTSAPANYFYANPPVKTDASPTAGPLTGGTAVTISGANLAKASSVTFGGTSGTITGNTAGTITATTPAGTSGAASIVATTPGGSTNGLTFTYTDVPTISSISPILGSTAGGTTVTINGTNLATATQVTFDGTPVTALAALSDTKLAVVTPAHALGIVDVSVTNPAGSDTVTGAFTYIL